MQQSKDYTQAPTPQGRHAACVIVIKVNVAEDLATLHPVKTGHQSGMEEDMYFKGCLSHQLMHMRKPPTALLTNSTTAIKLLLGCILYSHFQLLGMGCTCSDRICLFSFAVSA
ncbi:hypothetical protein WJX82_001094 [Trebouxia sp. C0006]